MAKAKVRTTKTTEKVVIKKAAAVDTDAPPAKKAKKANPPFVLNVPTLPTKSGHPLACGQNDVGQLGFHTDEVDEKTRPVLLKDIIDIVDVKAGGMHSLCLTKNGEIWSFGCNDEGALGRDTTEEGSEMKPAKISLPKKVVRISCGDSHSACLLENGSVYAWGSFRDAHGSMGLTIEGKKQAPIRVLSEIIAVDIASGSDHFVVLANNGKVFTIGCGEQGQLGRATIRTLTGESRRGKTSLLTPGVIMKKAKHFIADAIWATPYCTFLRDAKTAEIYGFGLNNYNQICVKKGANEFEHFPVLTKIKDAKKIAGGQHHTIVLTNDNQVYSIGRKEYGRLGLGDVQDDVAELTHITALKDKKIVDISCGAENTLALSEDGKLYVFGSGTSSTLGTGSEDDVPIPKLLESAQTKDKKLLAVSGGGQHSLFLVEVASTEVEEKKTSNKKTTGKEVKEAAAKESVKEVTKVNGSESKEEEKEQAEKEPTNEKKVNGNAKKTEIETNAEDKAAPKRGRKRKA
ncbi:hypothetical protein PVAND_010399 [Polypedilum vanderplanki]|uniref:RCC1-like domain-containing protein n=1 Tax=Polypedilum vanderplanki TaxID=319348 RepID=A0A9J6CGL0_POLVA|nr:hypothetical protein PVAND_010399 [Polypedilum vanderplanki]